MAHPVPIHRYCFADYLQLEEASNVKHEFLGGEIYAMAGGSVEHAALAAMATGLLTNQLRDGRCRVFSSDLRVRVPATGLATYPDVTVVCGEVQHDSESRHVVVNPTLLIEVLSDSTEDYDRGEKLSHYEQLDSLQTVVLVSHRTRRVEVHARTASGAWERRAHGPSETALLPAIGCELRIDDLYAGLDIE